MKRSICIVCGKHLRAWSLGPSWLLITILAILTVLSLPLTPCKARQLENPSFYEQKRTTSTGKSLNLAIPDFRMSGGEARYKVLERALPELVAVGLIENEMVRYVDRGEFWRRATRKFSLVELRRNPDIVFKDEILEALNIHLILRGNFFEYGGKIRFEATLEDRRNQKAIEISSSAVNVRAIYRGIADLAEELNAEILAIVREGVGKSLAIQCFSDESSEPSSLSQRLGKNIAISLISHIHLKDEISVLPWSTMKFFCGKDFLTDQEILEKAEADALLKGSFLVDHNSIIVSPKLYIKETMDLIELIPIEGDLSNYSEFEDNLVNDVSNILEAIIEGGTWNIEPLLYSDDPKHYLKKGKQYMQPDGNTYLAALMLSRAIKIEPNSSEAHYYLGLVRKMQGRYRDAVCELKRAIGINETFAEAHKSLGDIYLKFDKYQEALEEFKKASKIAPDHPGIHLSLGKVYYYLGKYDMTIQELQKALEKDVRNPEIYDLLGRAYRSLESVEKAIDAYLRGTTIDPDNPALRSSLLNIYLEEGQKRVRSQKYADALEFFNQAKALEPSASVYGWLIFVLNNLNRYEESLKILDEAMEIGFVDANLYIEGGEALHRLMRYDEAITVLNHAIELNPNDPYAYYNRGAIYLNLDDYDKAIDDFNKAIESDYPDIAACYAALGVTYTKRGKYEMALDNFDKAIALDASYLSAYLRRAELHIICNDFENALGDILKSSPLVKKDVNITYRATYFYLECIAKKLLGMDTSICNSELDELIKGEILVDWSFNEIDWSFNEIEMWLKDAHIPEDSKRYIYEKTNMLKRHGK